MDIAQFWTLVESSKAASRGSFDRHIELLAKHLSALTPEEIIEFQRIFDDLTDRAYSWDLWGAAYIIGGGCSDDGFTDFRSWLISMGRETYTRALTDPESLADIVLGPGGEEDSFFEEFGYVATQVYEAKTGRPLDYPRTAHPAEPSGRKREEDRDELARRYPRLSSQYQRD